MKRNLFKFLFLFIILLVMLGLYINSHHIFKIKSENKQEILKDIKNNNASYEITLDNTTFNGLSNNQLPYVIKAQKAIKCSADIYKLENLNAIYSIGSSELKLVSNEGVLNNQNNIVDLKGEIRGELQDIILNTDAITINLLTHEIYGNNDVKIEYNDSQINANQFNIIEDNIITLKGNVRTKIKLQK